MIIALFGDVHGNLPAMYDLCQRWQTETGETIDLVLQTGDMGLWRNIEKMDRATRKHFKQDKKELGSALYLSGELVAPIETWFIHGNHENFSLLQGSEGRAVDPAGRMIFLGPGSIKVFNDNIESLSVAALGGMEYRFGKYPVPTHERVQKYLHAPSLMGLMEQRPDVDFLLLHDSPLNRGLRTKFPTGSKRLTELIQALKPRFAFYGHYHDPPAPFCIDTTLCACMNFPGARRIPDRDGAMGIIRTNPWAFQFVPAESQD